MKAICLEDLNKIFKEYKKNKVKIVSLEIDENEGKEIQIVPDRKDVQIRKIPKTIFL
jgi:chemotaxis receptor (MCP) glutamine deamidase CheD